MASRKRQGNNPKRRVASDGAISSEVRGNLARARYVGSAHHKSRPADYGFIPPVNPRPGKSLCDDIRIVTRREAIRLFHSAIHLEMMSSYLVNGLPKFVWAVDILIVLTYLIIIVVVIDLKKNNREGTGYIYI